MTGGTISLDRQVFGGRWGWRVGFRKKKEFYFGHVKLEMFIRQPIRNIK